MAAHSSSSAASSSASAASSSSATVWRVSSATVVAAARSDRNCTSTMSTVSSASGSRVSSPGCAGRGAAVRTFGGIGPSRTRICMASWNSVRGSSTVVVSQA